MTVLVIILLCVCKNCKRSQNAMRLEEDRETTNQNDKLKTQNTKTSAIRQLYPDIKDDSKGKMKPSPEFIEMPEISHSPEDPSSMSIKNNSYV